MNAFHHLAAGLLAVFLLSGAGSAADNADAAADGGPTPPRLSLIEGEVSFSRPNAGEWTTAVLNTPLAAGDALLAGDGAGFELQIGRRAFVRAGERTQIELLNVEPDRLRFRVRDGRAALDLRDLRPQLTIEVETANADISIDRAGYYRLTVDEDTTFFNIRRAGAATVLAVDGQSHHLDAEQELIIEGTTTLSVASYPVTAADAWDRWNDERSDHLAAAASDPYLPPDVYGGEALDVHGSWRDEPEYGPLWTPAGQAPDWAPYSDGHWVMDPFYGWTWIDRAPWGWAPFHYGRWVFVRGAWAWAPGPRVVHTVYSPALVVFFHSHQHRHKHKTKPVSWVALSWGEPQIPWWGRRGFIGRPWWGGWHGPRLVKTVDDQRGASHHFRNTRVHNALVAVPQERFGRGPVRRHRTLAAAGELTPVAGALPVQASAGSWAAGPVSKLRPQARPPFRSATTPQTSRERENWRSGSGRGIAASPAGPAPVPTATPVAAPLAAPVVAPTAAPAPVPIAVPIAAPPRAPAKPSAPAPLAQPGATPTGEIKLRHLVPMSRQGGDRQRGTAAPPTSEPGDRSGRQRHPAWPSRRQDESSARRDAAEALAAPRAISRPERPAAEPAGTKGGGVPNLRRPGTIVPGPRPVAPPPPAVVAPPQAVVSTPAPRLSQRASPSPAASPNVTPPPSRREERRRGSDGQRNFGTTPVTPPAATVPGPTPQPAQRHWRQGRTEGR